MINETKATILLDNPYKVLISALLSQRTRDPITEKVSKQLFRRFPNPKTMSVAPLKQIQKTIKPINYYKNKARKIKKISKILISKYKGKVPRTEQELLSLPGVGRKTAACVLVYSYAEPSIPVDTHVHRIFNRLGIIKTKTPEKTQIELYKKIPKKEWLQINNLFVKFGQQICLPRNPRCNLCTLKNQCHYYKKILRSNSSKGYC
jgi:endonuclease-3